jgi:hypothetical protein
MFAWLGGDYSPNNIIGQWPQQHENIQTSKGNTPRDVANTKARYCFSFRTLGRIIPLNSFLWGELKSFYQL